MRIVYGEKYKNTYVITCEFEPQTRSIYVNHQYRKVPFPYILMTFSFEKIGNEYIFYGVYRTGLIVSLKEVKIKNITDLIFNSPTDHYGVVCTDHNYDKKKFNCPIELCKTIANLWLSSLHYCALDASEWSKMTIKEFCNSSIHINKKMQFGIAIKRFTYGESRDLKLENPIIDLPFECLPEFVSFLDNEDANKIWPKNRE